VLAASQSLYSQTADRPNGTHRRLRVSATLAPATVGLAYSAVISVNGGTSPYQFSSQNLPTWLTLNPATGGLSGTPAAAGQIPFSILVSDSAGDRGLGWFSLTVNNKGSLGVTIMPPSVTVSSGGTQQFLADVSNSSNTAVNWTASAGKISPSGLFTAPTVTSNTTVTVTATSVANAAQTASALVTVSTTGGGGGSGKVSLEVLFPPTHPNNSRQFQPLQSYLLNNPIVSGGNLVVEWGMIDQGPGASPQYDWSALDEEIAPWTVAGKKVNLIVWANSDSTAATCSDGTASTTGNCAIPAYVWQQLGPSNYVSCSSQYGTQRIPNYLDQAGFQIPYQQFMAAVVQKYGSSPAIGYIRIGLGHGGETIPVSSWNDSSSACGQAFAKWGVTVTSWETYLAGMLSYEAGLRSPKQLMVGVTPMGVRSAVPNYVAPLAVPMHVGFGSQGWQQSDITNYPNCTANWCNLFAEFAGQGVPLELQTVLESCPDRSCATGSLVDLVPFAVAHNATVLEIYYSDWLIAFDPANPDYAQYGAAYAQVLTQAATGK